MSGTYNRRVTPRVVGLTGYQAMHQFTRCMSELCDTLAWHRELPIQRRPRLIFEADYWQRMSNQFISNQGQLMQTINEKGPLDVGYIAGLNAAQVGIYARSLADAKQKAVEHFKPRKRDVGLLWVERASED